MYAFAFDLLLARFYKITCLLFAIRTRILFAIAIASTCSSYRVIEAHPRF
jgi:hypothetical protein